jgi:hypothetical protein
MKGTSAVLSLAVTSMFALAACSHAVPTPTYTQSRAINQDIEATHVVGPTTTSPAFTQKTPAPALTPWRGEETIDLQRQQIGQLPR